MTEPPDEGFWEVTCKLDIAEAKGRKKRTLYRKSEKERRLCAKEDYEYLRTKAGCIRLLKCMLRGRESRERKKMDESSGKGWRLFIFGSHGGPGPTAMRRQCEY